MFYSDNFYITACPVTDPVLCSGYGRSRGAWKCHWCCQNVLGKGFSPHGILWLILFATTTSSFMPLYSVDSLLKIVTFSTFPTVFSKRSFKAYQKSILCGKGLKESFHFIPYGYLLVRCFSWQIYEDDCWILYVSKPHFNKCKIYHEEDGF